MFDDALFYQAKVMSSSMEGEMNDSLFHQKQAATNRLLVISKIIYYAQR